MITCYTDSISPNSLQKREVVNVRTVCCYLVVGIRQCVFRVIAISLITFRADNSAYKFNITM